MPVCWWQVNGTPFRVKSGTHRDSTVELAMEPDTWTEDNRRGDHDVDACDCGSCFKLEVLAGRRVSTIGLFACCAGLQSCWVVVELMSQSILQV